MPFGRSKAYTDAGVNISAGYELVNRIRDKVAKTRTPGVVSELGGFGGLFRPDLGGMEAPVLVSSTDGVGTKLKLAFEYNKHDTIGIDLVAMSVNDILVQGARPLFFLDYFATGKLDVEKAEQVIAGIAEGCCQAGCALLGGETAEMPDMYREGEYDLAGFCVGIVDSHKIVDGSTIRKGDRLVGIASSGLHSNGYSLARKILAAENLSADDIFPGTERSVRDVLLTPTIIYVDAVRHLLRDLDIKGMAHITGGGIYENVPRSLPTQVEARINFGSWQISPEFQWLKEKGNLEWREMLQIFNCGIGYVLVVSQDIIDELIGRLSGMNMRAYDLGSVEIRRNKEIEQVIIEF